MRFLLSLLLFTLASPLAAQDEDLSEAVGLEPEKDREETKETDKAIASPLRMRGYVLIDWRSRKGAQGRKTSAPNAELSLNLQAAVNSQVSAFAEGRVFYLREDDDTKAVLDQGGLRANVGDHWSAALGRERNRRAPGLLISPSDILHSTQSAPGLPEDRSGVWLGRLSWQTEQQSLDFIILPVSDVKDTGWPDEKSEFLGGAVRWFGRFGGYDFSIDLGSLDESFRSGASVQGIFATVWKSYLEGGYEEKAERGSALFGLSYEGSDDFTARAEIFHNAAGTEPGAPALAPAANANAANAVTTAPAAATQGLFPRQDYVIGHLSFMEIQNRWNLRETWIKSLEDSGSVHLLSLEYIVNDQSVLGTTWIRISGDSRSQYGRRPFDWQLLCNAKFSF